MLLKVRFLVANVVFLGKRATEVWEPNCRFQPLQSCKRKPEFEV